MKYKHEKNRLIVKGLFILYLMVSTFYISGLDLNPLIMTANTIGAIILMDVVAGKK